MHGRIYEAIGKLIERGQIANPVTLKNLFDQDGALAEIGGAQYLARLAESAVTIINAEDYGRTHPRSASAPAADRPSARRWSTTRSATTSTTPPGHRSSAPSRNSSSSPSTGEAEGGLRPFRAALTEAIELGRGRLQARRPDRRASPPALSISTRSSGGLHPSDLIILAGRPSMGKTALATNIAFNAAKAYRTVPGPDGRPVAEDGAVIAFFSLEMSAEQLATRILAEESGMSSDRIRRGECRREDFDKFVLASQRLAAVPLYIDDTPAIVGRGAAHPGAPAEAPAGAGADRRRLSPADAPVGHRSRAGEPRAGDLRHHPRPQGDRQGARRAGAGACRSCRARSSSARTSARNSPICANPGSIEQDADVVMFIFREEYYHQAEQPKINEDETKKNSTPILRLAGALEENSGIAEVIIAKQRHGPIGTVKLHFEAETTKFDNFIGPETLPATVLNVAHRLPSDPADPRAGAVLEIDLGAIVANWRLLAAAGGARRVRRGRQGQCLRARRRDRSPARSPPPGAGRFFVATLDEGIALRAALGPEPEIAVFNGPLPGPPASLSRRG